MFVIGVVTQSEPREVGDKTYHNLAIDNLNVRPGRELTEYPAAGSTIQGTVQSFWPQEKGGRPYFVLSHWEYLSSKVAYMTVAASPVAVNGAG